MILYSGEFLDAVCTTYASSCFYKTLDVQYHINILKVGHYSKQKRNTRHVKALRHARELLILVTDGY